MNGTVLVVDDEPDILLLVRVILEGAGWEVQTAESGEEALSALAEQVPDVLLLDLRMPGIDGWDVLDRLAGNGDLGRLAVVMFSAHAEVGTERRAFSCGCQGYLRKPFSPPELVEAVEQALGTHA